MWVMNGLDFDCVSQAFLQWDLMGETLNKAILRMLTK
jgi:hypothetical protein